MDSGIKVDQAIDEVPLANQEVYEVSKINNCQEGRPCKAKYFFDMLEQCEICNRIM